MDSVHFTSGQVASLAIRAPRFGLATRNRVSGKSCLHGRFATGTNSIAQALPFQRISAPKRLILSMSSRKSGRRSSGAFTLIEVLMATMVIFTAMGAIFLVGSRCMGIIQCSQDVAAASATLHERMQQLQATPWLTLTDSESFADQVWTDPETGTTENFNGLLKNATTTGSELRQRAAVESVRVSAYRPIASAAAVPAPITVTRTATTPTVTSAATSLVDEKMVRIDLRLTWTDGRVKIPRSLALSTVVARK